MTKNRNRTFRIAAIALFIAIAYISSLLLPLKVQFLTLDIKDAFITIGALYFGPVAGIVISAAVALLEFLWGSSTGVYGLIMNFLGSATFSTVAALIYIRKKSLANAVISLLCACITVVVVMLAANLIITPLFMAAHGMTKQAVEEMILPLLLPFNAIKSVLNAALVLLLYKPISVALKKARLGESANDNAKLNKNSVIIAIIAIAFIAASLAFLFVKLGASF